MKGPWQGYFTQDPPPETEDRDVYPLGDGWFLVLERM